MKIGTLAVVQASLQGSVQTIFLGEDDQKSNYSIRTVSYSNKMFKYYYQAVN